ncbi:hypothetical protein [Tsukamurella tyrosinosolvens]|uniref:hypothetical protein n=1 Tax=Tsukamurella tyrosinosolvens TaxID=57704 RepID=UPI000DF6D4BF|nr:hypothetical protein [Tsukamurella tyrosinosolvens]RDB49361.1 hypothetical protein DVB87_03260 [Tsukamurella tyrosinosolvens]
MNASSPISATDRDRFLREVVANSGPNGITPEALESALGEFIRMNIDAAALDMWHSGEITFAWSDDGMIWKLQ